MKKLSLAAVIIALLIPQFVAAQDTQEQTDQEPTVTWNKNLRLRFFLDHVYQDNWSKGGVESFNWKVDVENNFARKGQKTTWDNKVRVRYSQNNVGSGADKQRRVNLNEIKGRTALIFEQGDFFLNPFFGGTLETQIATGYKYPSNAPREPRSAFWDPVVLKQNFGFDVSGIKYTKLRVSIDYKQEMADKYVQFYKIDDRSTEKVEKIKVTKSMTVWSEYRQQFNDKLAIQGVFEANYGFMHYSETVVDFETTIDFKLYEFLNLSVFTEFRYNKDESKRRQLRNTVGLSFIFDLFK